MWLAIRDDAGAGAHFIGTASRAVARREAELDVMREQAARTERLVSLTTLAAGAAHELSTPLATIRDRVEGAGTCACTRDGRRRLHGRRATDSRGSRSLPVDPGSDERAAQAAAPRELPEAVGIDAVLADVKARLTTDLADRLCTHTLAPMAPIVVPRAGLVQVLLSLVKNAFDATPQREPVTIDVEAANGLVRFVIQDEGEGMSQETLRPAPASRSTRRSRPGQGFGLGVFLARAFAERCGGSLSLRSDRGNDRDPRAASRLGRDGSSRDARRRARRRPVPCSSSTTTSGFGRGSCTRCAIRGLEVDGGRPTTTMRSPPHSRTRRSSRSSICVSAANPDSTSCDASKRWTTRRSSSSSPVTAASRRPSRA